MRHVRRAQHMVRSFRFRPKLPEVNGTLDDVDELPYDAVGSGYERGEGGRAAGS